MAKSTIDYVRPPKTAILHTQQDVTDVAAALPTAALAGRRGLVIRNNGTKTIEIGDATVTYGTGFPIKKGEAFPIDIDATPVIYAIADSGDTVDVRVLEIS